MESYRQFAQNLINEASEILSFPISLTDDEGMIIGSTVKERIGTYHSASIEVIREKQPVCYEEADVEGMPNVYPGVAVPLIFEEEAICVLGIVGKPAEVLPYAKLVKRYAEMVWHETYQNRLETLEAKKIDTFVQHLLFDPEPDVARIEDYCNLLGIEANVPRCCIIIEINGQQKGREVALHESLTSRQAYRNEWLKENISRTLCNHDQDLMTQLNAEQLLVFKGVGDSGSGRLKSIESECQSLIESLHSNGWDQVEVSIGDVKRTIGDIGSSYHNAKHLMEVGRRLQVPTMIYSFHDWGLLLRMVPFYIEPFLKRKLINRLEHLVGHDDFQVLAQNFFSYCENNMNVSKAARELYIHRNTLIYRLGKIEALTELDLNSFEHCTILYLTLKNTGVHLEHGR
ncbi:CdaR family transcriptional regulator [Thalassobacillus hwangdonensis]|uniref:CdaR family transcriptional regulator n=1 Tax=Thalassobacillus hwangdonensis TaxID=546108 RepID=A0ABW3L1J5_9BACI